MPTGTVKKFFQNRGYGFITDAVTGQDIWFHCTYIWNDPQIIKVGDKVIFDVVPSEQEGLGPTARHIGVDGRELVQMPEAPPPQYPRRRPSQDGEQPDVPRNITASVRREDLLVKFMVAAITGLTVDWDDDVCRPGEVADTAYQIAKEAVDRLDT